MRTKLTLRSTAASIAEPADGVQGFASLHRLITHRPSRRIRRPHAIRINHSKRELWELYDWMHEERTSRRPELLHSHHRWQRHSDLDTYGEYSSLLFDNSDSDDC